MHPELREGNNLKTSVKDRGGGQRIILRLITKWCYIPQGCQLLKKIGCEDFGIISVKHSGLAITVPFSWLVGALHKCKNIAESIQNMVKV
jgi:hypothetical protein